MKERKKAYLVLEDGSIFEGYSFGSTEYVEGEVVFNTGMTGYQEVLTDPSYSGQIVTMTYPQIGNYGVIEEDNESRKIQVRGFVVKEYCDFPNNFRSRETLSDYLKRNNITGIEGIDTRKLTKILRNYGTMKGLITTTRLPDNKMIELAKNSVDISKEDLVIGVTTEKEYVIEGNGLNLGIVDFGMKLNIARLLNKMGHKITVMRADTDSKYILNKKFDMVLLSNGPGDPAIVKYGINTTREIIGKVPVTGICLGHQIIGLALGATTYKLKFGHRGSNHPVKNLITNKVYITTQNHGYAVDKDSLPEGVELTHINLNDNTVEGFLCKKKKVYCVQFHPEAGPGPHDCHHILKEFVDMSISN
ncbi:MAG TPA: glutamine-hydrolyzing carbamoyl-phosphate synthase small subunit [Spirochaetota bacterium]|nr:glutamine-hydrolyzing carbamoyl-phosphate synthase small subunit [Spirochaetota bacterium]HOL56136.1 glutamine-hydrolyzing carbamoyl-phosphate synthase small subunit [Spirochaetota bacterium]HPP03366.1 glutamine-hydrolyzing carbamoyl-phosphate synthase small subunit [Spirochaetota bacterium]